MTLNRNLKLLPSDPMAFLAWDELLQEDPDTDVFLIDLWPVHDPVILIADPEVANQVTVKYNLPKPAGLERLFDPVLGGPGLITMHGTEWKVWRGVFNTGFSANHITSLLPSIVDSVEIFCELLHERVGKKHFSLDMLASRLTMDIITKVTLGTDLDNQHVEHRLSKALCKILEWHSFWDPRILLNPLRPLIQWYYGRVIDTFLHAELEKGFAERRQTSTGNLQHSKRARSIVALALDDYIAQGSGKGKDFEDTERLGKEFKKVASAQIRTFLFAGNDTTSSTMQYMYHLLSKHPEALKCLRQEHDAIFGTSRDAASQLREKPTLINQCHYSLAVIKETLRLFAPAGTERAGLVDVSLTDRHGNIYPTQGLCPMVSHRHMHLSPRLWVRPQEFLPQRWLVEPGHELYPSNNSGAFRPFEQGPRSCIGQTLVLHELRVVLVLTARTFEITPAYDEWDAEQRANERWVRKMARRVGLVGEDIKTVMGERAYQSSRPGAHPADGYPCRVSLVREADVRE